MDKTIEKEDVVKAFTTNYKIAPPYIRVDEDGQYTLVGQSDLATGEMQEYGEFGKGKLTALNHTITLSATMVLIKIIGKLYDEDMMDFEDKEIMSFLEGNILDVLVCFFGDETKLDYSDELAYAFVMANKQLINEALYNVTNDKEFNIAISPQEIDDSLEGSQFIDPYVNIAHEIAKNYKMRPYDIISNWSTSELIVTFAKISNDNSLSSFINYKYSQPKAPKQRPPKKQTFYFEEIGSVEDE